MLSEEDGQKPDSRIWSRDGDWLAPRRRWSQASGSFSSSLPVCCLYLQWLPPGPLVHGLSMSSDCYIFLFGPIAFTWKMLSHRD